MRIHKGKVKFNTKDTWNMDSVFSEVIVEGVKKFKGVISDPSKNTGIPSSILEEMVEEGLLIVPEFSGIDDQDFPKCQEYYLNVLDNIIFAFGDNEPDIGEYNYEYKGVMEEADGELFNSLVCTDEEEKARYLQDFKDHREKCKEGRMLFAKHFDSLWW